MEMDKHVGFLLILVFRILQLTSATSLRSTVYYKTPGVRLEGIGQTEVPCPRGQCPGVGRIQCANFCIGSSSCRSFNFNRAEKRCVLNDHTTRDFGARQELDESWDYFSEREEDEEVKDGGWFLAFRGQHGNGIKIKDVWANETMTNRPSDLSATCISAISGNCTHHYRSHWLTDWTTVNITKVLLRLYLGGQKVAEMEFNGINSTKDDWYSKTRLTSTGWSDLPAANPAYFSIKGLNNRHFYISNEPGAYNCGSNFGWLAIIDKALNFCNFDKQTGLEPVFLYSHGSTGTIFETGADKAEVMAVFIKV